MPNFAAKDMYAERFRAFAFPGQQRIGTYTTNIGDGITVTAVAEFPTDGFARISGICKCNRALTVTVYQGWTSGSLEVQNVISIPANSSEGGGQYWEVPILGNLAKITVANTSGAISTSLTFAAFLSSAPGTIPLLTSVGVAVDTELPAPVVAADGLASPTAPQVLSHLLAWSPTANAWQRCRVDANNNLLTTTIIGTSAINSFRSTGIGQTPVNIAAGARYLHSLQIENLNATKIYLHLWNKAVPNPGVDVPFKSIPVYANGFDDFIHTTPLYFGTALSISASTVVDGTGAIGTNCVVGVDYL